MDPLHEFASDVVRESVIDGARNDLHNAKVIVRRNEYLLNELLDQLARMWKRSRR